MNQKRSPGFEHGLIPDFSEKIEDGKIAGTIDVWSGEAQRGAIILTDHRKVGFTQDALCPHLSAISGEAVVVTKIKQIGDGFRAMRVKCKNCGSK